jgi:hypothetical protein
LVFETHHSTSPEEQKGHLISGSGAPRARLFAGDKIIVQEKRERIWKERRRTRKKWEEQVRTGRTGKGKGIELNY